MDLLQMLYIKPDRIYMIDFSIWTNFVKSEESLFNIE